MKFLRHLTIPLFAWIVLGLAGCQIVGFPEKKFENGFQKSIQFPLSIQVRDERSKVERGEAQSPDWIYYTRNAANQGVELGSIIGNRLNLYGATPGFQLIDPEMDVSKLSHVIRITYEKGYARWPAQPDQSTNAIQVEGRCLMHVKLLHEGRVIENWKIDYAPDDFRVPVAVIHRGNVRKMVGDSLEHQFQTTHNDVIEDLMKRLSKAWPNFVKPKHR
jgi:hypothetical protein